MTLPLFTLALLGYVGFRGPWLWRLLALLALSPLLRYADSVFGFAIRLQLSAWAGTLLRAAGFPVVTEGNVLLLSGRAMSVDPACMGLRMMGFTLLVAVFWLITHERRLARRVPLRMLLPYALLTVGLTLLSNLIRIVVLVAFGLGPDHPMHEGIGLVSVALYAWLPLMVGAKRFVQHAPATKPLSPAPGSGTLGTLATYQTALLPLRRHWDKALLIALTLLAFTRPAGPTYPTAARRGYAQQTTQFGFTQYSRPGQLVYVKPLPDWFSAEHSPAICWKGQGYTLRRIRETTVAGQPVYAAELQKGGHRLQTAWWFANGRDRSISQVDVRLRMLRGEPGFALINVTVAEASQLAPAIRAWL